MCKTKEKASLLGGFLNGAGSVREFFRDYLTSYCYTTFIDLGLWATK